MDTFKYEGKAVPNGYSCSKCKKSGIKMWRQYQTFTDRISLLCGKCALKNQKEKGPIDDDGFVDSELGMRTDSIGWLVPAVPTEDGHTYWGYTSVPADGVAWWRGLPTK